MSIKPTWLVLVMALLYLPASGYCLMEKADLVAPVDCCHETTSDDQKEQAPCEGYDCCPIEYAVYFSFDSGTADLITPPIGEVLFTVMVLMELPVEVPVLLLERSPPDIKTRLQILRGAARLPRAPSLIS